MRHARLLLIVGTALALSACSVTEPRNGFTASIGPSGQGAALPVADTGGSPAGDAGAVDPDGGNSGPGGAGQSAGVGAGVRPGAGGATTGSTGSGPGAATATTRSQTGAGPATGAKPAPGATSTSVTTRPAPAAPVMGITDKTITVSIVMGYGGPYGAVLNQIYGGLETAIDDVNAKGGIHGRTIVLKKVDHKETSGGGVAACKETLSNGSYFAMVAEGQGEANVTAPDCLDKSGFTNVSFVPELLPEWRHTYNYVPTGVTTGKSLASFVKNVMGDGQKKLGVLYVKTSIYEKGMKAYTNEAKALGLNVVAVESADVNQSSFTPQLLRLRNAGVENVAIISTIEAVGVLRDAKALNYQPHFTGMYWIFDFISQAAGPTAAGVQALRFSAPIDSPKFAEFQSRHSHYGRGSAADGESFLLYGIGQLLGRVLEAAGPTPTRESLVTGLQSIKNYDNGILPPITYGPGDFNGPDASFPVTCCLSNGAWKGAGAARATF